MALNAEAAFSSRRQKRKVCLVTNEIYPFAPGGIGRLISNWIVQNAEYDEPVDLHILFAAELKSKQGQISSYCENYGVTVHFCEDADFSQTYQGQLISTLPDDRWDYFHPYKVSYRYFLALLRLWKLSVEFDTVEFPDYGGWGAIAIEAKRAGICLLNSELVVRLHSTYGIIVDAEPYYHKPSGYGGCVIDMERFALDHADRVVAHIAAIATRNQQFYKFSDRWLRDVIIETPPIYGEVLNAKNEFQAGKIDEPVRFVFSSRLQPFKRPDLFIKGACVFFKDQPEAHCEAIIASYGWDETYISWLRDLIPDALSHKIKFERGLDPKQREELLNGSIIVIPSNYESYCLFAYESAAAGRPLMLRASCLAFGQHDLWQDGVNCMMFGDTPAELAAAMRRALSWKPASNVLTSPDRPYWCDDIARTVASPRQNVDSKHLAVDVLIYDIRTQLDLDRALHMVKTLKLQKATFLLNTNIAAAVNEPTKGNIDFIQSKYALVQLDEVWEVCAGLKSPIVSIVNVQDAPDTWFFEAAARVLSTNDSIAVVTCNDAIYDAAREKPISVAFAAGEHSSSAFAGMPVVGRIFCVRREAMKQIAYPTEARLSDWTELFLSLQGSSLGICVLPEVLNATNIASEKNASGPFVATRFNKIVELANCFVTGHGLSVPADGTALGGKDYVRIAVDERTPFQRLWPTRPELWGDPVSYNAQFRAWLVHPVDDDVVIARLHLNSRTMGAAEYFVEVVNASHDNHGLFFGLIAGNSDWDMNDVKLWISSLGEQENRHFVGPGERATLTCAPSIRGRTTDLYFTSRPRPGRSASNCLAMIYGLGAVM